MPTTVGGLRPSGRAVRAALPFAPRRTPAAALALALSVATGCTAPPPGDPDQVLADARAAARVRATLLGDPLVGGSAIAIEVHEGVVTLAGAVPDEAAEARALSLVRATPGVRAVVSRLAVAPPSASGAAR